MELNTHGHSAHILTPTPAAGDTAGLRALGACGLLKPDPHPPLCKASLPPTSSDCHPDKDPLA